MIAHASIERARARMQREEPHPHHWCTMLEDGRVPVRVHVVPVGDLRDHDAAPTCWCRPQQDDEQPLVWTHNSLDGREAFEADERALS